MCLDATCVPHLPHFPGIQPLTDPQIPFTPKLLYRNQSSRTLRPIRYPKVGYLPKEWQWSLPSVPPLIPPPNRPTQNPCRTRIEHARDRNREGQDTIGSRQAIGSIQGDDSDVPLVCFHLPAVQHSTKVLLRGNATDLSLLTHMTVEDINRLQSVGREAQESRKHFILHDDQVRASYANSPGTSSPAKSTQIGGRLVSRTNFERREGRSGLGQCRI